MTYRWVAVALLCACAGTTSEQLATCTLRLTTPATVVADAPAAFGLDPISDRWDIVAHIGGLSADVLATDASSCEACDACRTENACDACDDVSDACTTCVEACASCAPTVTLHVPDLSAGTWPIVVVDRYGQSDAAYVDVVEAPTEASNDTAAPVAP